MVCPDCQERSDWTAELDRCPRCGSTALVRRLGQTICRDCESASDASGRAVATDSARTAAEPLETADDMLAAEVAAAIDRVLGRVPSILGPRE